MCLAILTTGENMIPKNHLENGFKNNPHGAGFAVWDNVQNRLIMKKGFAHFAEFYHAYKPFRLMRGIVHFRWATHGGMGMENTHPFELKDGAYLIHNGVLHHHKMGKTDHDTQWFIKNILSELPSEWYLNEVYSDMVEEYIGSGNKFAIIGHGGCYSIINGHCGHWTKDGIWYSNSDYKSVSRWMNWNENYWDELDKQDKQELERFISDDTCKTSSELIGTVRDHCAVCGELRLVCVADGICQFCMEKFQTNDKEKTRLHEVIELDNNDQVIVDELTREYHGLMSGND